jgi:hypothetical protein
MPCATAAKAQANLPPEVFGPADCAPLVGLVCARPSGFLASCVDTADALDHSAPRRMNKGPKHHAKAILGRPE